ncbi:sensor domain-containing protein [Actinomadura sp. DC4]|uniref:sensor histidine kinase n=1 Tax=Actinomadura sp. DC4 TaxID=3055069 RepID=UPI0025AF8BC9|nr:sensor domain-containing protein [Actinomadura sp. DC4]MDN3356003.1 sensor domain-containing protein [Actinomadura sp. DC4]
MSRVKLGAVLRAPFGRRAWAEILYVVVSTPLAVLGFVYAIVTLVLGTGLAVTAAGFPLLAAGLGGARRITSLHRRLAARLLGEHLEAPARPRAGSGLLGRLQVRLGDAAGWRALCYLVLKLPMTLIHLYVLLVTWEWGVFALTYPAQHALGINQNSVGIHINGFVFDSRPRQLLVSVFGLALIVLGPWALRLSLITDRILMRWLLGRRGLAERVRDLEETRARAVDDAAATLRTIERDLHDGAQVRLIALTMQLTMVRDAVADDNARALVATAQATAREAIAELRELVRGIHPPALDHGLDTALATLAARSAVPVEPSIELATRPTAAIESIAYFCAAELLANVAKHSGATRAWLSLTQSDGRLRLRVRDDGSGGAVPGPGSGLSGLQDRVRTVDGRLDVASPPGGPTVVTVELPSHA